MRAAGRKQRDWRWKPTVCASREQKGRTQGCEGGASHHIGSRASAHEQEVVDSRRSRSPKRRDAQASQPQTSLPPTGRRVGMPSQTAPIGHSLMAIWAGLRITGALALLHLRRGRPTYGGGVTVGVRRHPANQQASNGAKAIVGNPRYRESQVGAHMARSGHPATGRMRRENGGRGSQALRQRLVLSAPSSRCTSPINLRAPS